jgi:5S rRNA maturation endonuclease (ribonuclease M5)
MDERNFEILRDGDKEVNEELQYEGEMIRKAIETKLKKYWNCLLEKELYVYKHKKLYKL